MTGDATATWVWNDDVRSVLVTDRACFGDDVRDGFGVEVAPDWVVLMATGSLSPLAWVRSGPASGSFEGESGVVLALVIEVVLVLVLVVACEHGVHVTDVVKVMITVYRSCTEMTVSQHRC